MAKVDVDVEDEASAAFDRRAPQRRRIDHDLVEAHVAQPPLKHQGARVGVERDLARRREEDRAGRRGLVELVDEDAHALRARREVRVDVRAERKRAPPLLAVALVHEREHEDVVGPAPELLQERRAVARLHVVLAVQDDGAGLNAATPVRRRRRPRVERDRRRRPHARRRAAEHAEHGEQARGDGGATPVHGHEHR